eukprot:scaffold246504_cov30-Tisochrysis_lutea.AAC.7
MYGQTPERNAIRTHSRYACARHMSRTVLMSENVLIVGSTTGSPASVTVTTTSAPGSALPKMNTITLHAINSGTPSCASRPVKRADRESRSTLHHRSVSAPRARDESARVDSAASPEGSQGTLDPLCPSSRLVRRLSLRPRDRRRRTQALAPRAPNSTSRRHVPETSAIPMPRRLSGGRGSAGELGGEPGQPRCA